MTSGKEFDTSLLIMPLLTHLLEGEVPNPRDFIDACSNKLEPFKQSIDPKFPKSMINSRAFYLLCYIDLKKTLGQGKAYEIIRPVLLTEGMARMNLVFDTASGRSFERLIEKVFAFNHSLNLPFEVTEQSADRFCFSLKRCTFWELCCYLEIPEATTLVCQVDNAFFNSYLPDEVKFSHGTPCSRLVDGASSCRFVFTRTIGLETNPPQCPSEVDN
ncbi:hypothetical protein GF359_10760 [candidate division WOR-3 bacterium]|uniref:L-2-amino-thiazoline-4-carboxylic acid hydrolase n=1 Tax=candidate division WOR-3 bacterium TaxID=2052148 RepID=A0A9D5QE27_UNCW3|nr:hypothetical protein [candidate division WOR-3 bacterium]MBD3365682.1 hypothetical protein [candidate division WOR-3 bacterium]